MLKEWKLPYDIRTREYCKRIIVLVIIRLIRLRQFHSSYDYQDVLY